MQSARGSLVRGKEHATGAHGKVKSASPGNEASATFLILALRRGHNLPCIRSRDISSFALNPDEQIFRLISPVLPTRD
jgi:hypothetical protein